MSTSGLNLTPSNSKDTLIQDGWFGENETLWPGQKFSIQVDEVLLNGRSEFQDILVFRSKTYGHVLVLDGVIQLTERDEFAYQEMITHLPLFAHPNPKKVLIIGGGDGGVLREVVKHPSVTTVHMCEIDRQVVEVGKKYFRETLSTAFDDPKVTLIFDDAAKYLLQESNLKQYDVIICDSSDPVGPAETLFQPQFFQSMYNALAPGGIVCTQGECQWLHLDLIANVLGYVRNIFPVVTYAYSTVPTYPSGQIGFVIASNDKTITPSEPSRPPLDEMNLRYYTSPIHRAAFVLPAFASKKLNL
eukprot:gene21390-27713_t